MVYRNRDRMAFVLAFGQIPPHQNVGKTAWEKSVSGKGSSSHETTRSECYPLRNCPEKSWTVACELDIFPFFLTLLRAQSHFLLVSASIFFLFRNTNGGSVCNNGKKEESEWCFRGETQMYGQTQLFVGSFRSIYIPWLYGNTVSV